MSKLYFSQTCVKDFEKEDTCPFRWKKQWVDKEIPFGSNEFMDRGKYFEQLVIGSGAIAGDDVTDLPRLKNGDKSADHQRIDLQAARAYKMLYDKDSPDYLGFTLKSVQLELRDDNKKGTADIEAVDRENHPWIIDLKLTSDITSDRSQYGWGNDWSQLDLIQMTHYEDLYYNMFGVRPKMGLLVLDYSPQKRATFGEIVITESKREQKTLRFYSAEKAFQLYEERGWIKIPSLKECGSCPLNCEMRLEPSKLVKKIITY